MDQLLGVVEVLTQHPHLRSLSLWQLVEFLTRVSSLKRSILLAGRATEPTDLIRLRNIELVKHLRATGQYPHNFLS
jgi:hypothetical protein